MTRNPSNPIPSTQTPGSDRPALLVRSRTARGLAHIGAAVLSLIIVFSVAGKIANDYFFPAPTYSRGCDDGTRKQSQVQLTRDEWDEACGMAVPLPPYTANEARQVALTVRSMWPEISNRLTSEGYEEVNPDWLDQFNDADVAYLIHKVCVDAPKAEASEENPERLVHLALFVNLVEQHDDIAAKSAMTGAVIIATTVFCPEHGERLGIS